MGLPAVLRAEAEEDDLAFAEGHGYRGGFAGEAIGAVDPSGEEDVFVVFGIGGEHPALHVGCGAVVSNAMAESRNAAVSEGMPCVTGCSARMRRRTSEPGLEYSSGLTPDSAFRTGMLNSSMT